MQTCEDVIPLVIKKLPDSSDQPMSNLLESLFSDQQPTPDYKTYRAEEPPDVQFGVVMTEESGPQADLLARVREAQQSLQDAQLKLATTTVEGFGGGGAVRAILHGSGEVLDVVISPSAVDPGRVTDLSQMVVAALQEAQASLKTLHQESVNPLLKSLGGLTS